MTVKYGKFEMPNRIVVEHDAKNEKKAKFVLEPFERGFAHTIGNSLRRVLLSSLEAPALLSVSFQGVPHEYLAIEGVIEDVTDILLNFKGALLRKLPTDDKPDSRHQHTISTMIDVTQSDLDREGGNVEVTLGDVLKDGQYDVVNPDHHLFTVTQPFKRQLQLKVGMGRGYVPSERHVISNRGAEEMVLDSAFSPVRLVNYYVENTRVGQDTDFDKLILEVNTDGRVTPEEALSFAAQIAVNHFEVFNQVKTHTLTFLQEEHDRDEAHEEVMEKLALRIDEIELSVRSTNCLSGANIATIAELVSIPERRMLEFRNFGKKSLNEIKAKLEEMGLSLGMELSRNGLTPENMEEKLKPYMRERPEIEETLDEQLS